MEGILPDLDSKLEIFRHNQQTLLTLFYSTLLVTIFWTLKLYKQESVIPTVTMCVVNIWILSSFKDKKSLVLFEDWRRIWPSNLLIPGNHFS